MKAIAGSPRLPVGAARPQRGAATGDAVARQQTGRNSAPPYRATQPRSPAVLAVQPTPPSLAGEQPAAVRISKLMAERGLCSRRDADDYIARGWVFVDGRRVSELGSRAARSVVITLDRRALAAQEACLTILLHKPVGYVSGQPEPGCTPAVALIQAERQFRTTDTPAFHPSCLRGLAPAGRLDIDSTGLLVLTQDGRVARRLVGEDSTIDKEYLVRVAGQLDERGLALLNHGLSLDDRRLKAARVEWLNADQLRFVLREGRKRQIRRMCELVGLRVLALKRVRIGAVRLGDLPLGQWRFLRPGEVF
ncbi:pseudouridine synthase [Accumulibacter sp.]|uniref:pseudouridine synthase n=1 Tax=Accumulibacter sp. TaxID=2053492 RepID=UPI0025F2139D|nr:pseudouridine synthase [Accumulibacter sp.]MCM8612535.1 rRNA pseudouridine synthase [Accumulibacter sp.]MCM8636434.1 rRNA pseudouridine synthase [Accumulibacter sp.]MCM8640167.1 rRNA pseudouridine synthase [Accumulibacter sp.]